MKMIGDIFNYKAEKAQFTAESLAKMDIRWPYPPTRVNWCSACCASQNRKDFARIRSGERSWDEKQAVPNISVPGSSVCEGCRVTASRGPQDASRNRFGGGNDR